MIIVGACTVAGLSVYGSQWSRVLSATKTQKPTDAKSQLKKAQREARREGHQKLLFMHLNREGLPLPQAEYVFHPTRKWALDFAWHFCSLETFEEIRLALEVEGGIYTKGKGHRSITNFESDMEKYNELTAYNWKLIRVLPEHLEMKSMVAINLILRILRPLWPNPKDEVLPLE